MIVLHSLIAAFILFLTIARAIVNAKIYNNLHKSDQKMMYSATNTSKKELDRSNESILFAFYCSFVIIWFKFKKNDIKLVILNYFLVILTALIVLLLIKIK